MSQQLILSSKLFSISELNNHCQIHNKVVSLKLLPDTIIISDKDDYCIF